MKILLKEVENVRAIIRDLDEDLITDAEAHREALRNLARCYDRRESMLLLRLEMIKERSPGTEEIANAESLVREVMKEVSDSGYLGVDPKSPFKRKRGRPKSEVKKISNARMRLQLTKRAFRFAMSEDMSIILDEVHREPEYKIRAYEGMTAANAQEVIAALLAQVGNRETQGWVKCKTWWRGAFQNGVYKDFRDQQIERGSVKKGHNGFWRFYTNAEFDQKSSVGRFRFRTVNE